MSSDPSRSRIGARSASPSLTVVIQGFDLPGRSCRPGPSGTTYQEVHVGLCSRSHDRLGLSVVPHRPWQVAEPVPGDAASARWEIPVSVRRADAGIDFGGPFVRGDRTDRHLGLAWGEVPGDGLFHLFRAAKLCLVDVDPRLVEEALELGRLLTASVRLTDHNGNPICARIRSPDVTWSIPTVT
ncbi:MAG TPA: DUF5990 family protein [Candidatus Dormibacteraeota bacterium]|nr:DUF5990 family protein [Candidatus Dormibacteraeota bacterium]